MVCLSLRQQIMGSADSLFVEPETIDFQLSPTYHLTFESIGGYIRRAPLVRELEVWRPRRLAV